MTIIAGDVVSHNGDKWTANQWNYDEAPGGPAGAWNDDAPAEKCCGQGSPERPPWQFPDAWKLSLIR